MVLEVLAWSGPIGRLLINQQSGQSGCISGTLPTDYLHLKGATFLHTRIVWGLLTASWWVESAVEPGRAGSLGSLSSPTHPREVSRARFPCWPTGVPDKGSAHA